MASVSASPAWPNQLKIGFHLSIAGGPENLFRRFRERHCTALQIFVSSPRVWERKLWRPETLESFRIEHRKAGKPPLVVHTRYLINLASANPLVRERSVELLQFEYRAAADCGADYLVLHMGSHADLEKGILYMKENLDKSLGERAGQKPLLLLENTAGERNDLGARLEQIEAVQQGISFPTGICLDTCHAYQAGYNLGTAAGRKSFTAGLSRLAGPHGVRVIHLNDSKKPFAGHHDRHENIGQGHIGGENLARFLLLSAFKGLPVILETPQAGTDDPAPDLENFSRLKQAFKVVTPKSR